MGHLFVVQSRLETFVWDAVLIPTSGLFGIRPYWRAVVTGDVDLHKPTGWAWGSAAQSRQDPRIWFIDVTDSPADIAQRLSRVFDRIATDLPRTGVRSNELPRIALPVLGAGGGGKGDSRGRMVKILAETAHDTVQNHPVDIVIAAINPSDYAALQAHRRDNFSPTTMGFEGRAKELADAARSRHLALFIGAGASLPAGLPSWGDLLDKVGGKHRNEVRQLNDPLDQGELLRREFRDGLGQRVADATDSGGIHALSHALLASLGCREVVTTNFDQCYESAVEPAITLERFAVLPWSAPKRDEPWLLKMHGSRDRPESIVLARRDFVQFQGRSGPAGALLQSILMTRHLLVIGASFTDSNLLRLVHEVAAFREANGVTAPMGTVVTLLADPAREALLEGDFHFLAMTSPDEGDDLARAARRLEVFLDVLAMHAASSAPHLLDRRYVDLLTRTDEAELATELSSLLPRVEQLAEKSEAWRDVAVRLHGWGAGWVE